MQGQVLEGRVRCVILKDAVLLAASLPSHSPWGGSCNPPLSTCRRGDVDDRVLCEAMLPLLQALASAPDVRPVLHRRFDMPRWFMSQARASCLCKPRLFSACLAGSGHCIGRVPNLSFACIIRMRIMPWARLWCPTEVGLTGFDIR